MLESDWRRAHRAFAVVLVIGSLAALLVSLAVLCLQAGVLGALGAFFLTEALVVVIGGVAAVMAYHSGPTGG